ncbi:hypothetical protein LSTR_LSTR005733 [Laodelphax striatellus]|uniref:Uncharacterized protein n=1 Tax=Laodelphax striatellus TaxID=195883 RepID=A0A482XJS1_LAOST|nr:hypothetical protein LSTR_LSTR005733 [Laodelphax striatellus]
MSVNWSANDSDKEEPEPADDGKYLRVPKNPISKKDPYKPPGWLPPLIPAEKVEVDWDINTDEPSTQQDSDGRRPNDGGRGRNDGGRRPNNDGEDQNDGGKVWQPIKEPSRIVSPK